MNGSRPTDVDRAEAPPPPEGAASTGRRHGRRRLGDGPGRLPLLDAAVDLLEIPGPDARAWQRRISRIERNVVMPIKFAAIAMVLYSFYSSPWWVGRVEETLDITFEISLEWTQQFLWVYAAINLVIGASLLAMRRLPPGLVQWIVFAAGLVDGVFLSTLLVLTGGYQSFLYWLFPALIVRNAVCVPRATSQLVLNFTVIACFVMAGTTHLYVATKQLEEAATREAPAAPPRPVRPRVRDRAASPVVLTNLQRAVPQAETSSPAPVVLGAPATPSRASEREESSRENPAEPLIARLVLLLLLTFCSYGVQVLMERQRRALEEAREFAVREVQLHAAGRLAAQFAHQIKNPLAIINTAAYSLQRSLKSRPDLAEQIQMIKEEVEHADRIITQVMGYAQLSEGHVEKLSVPEELDSAIERVFPPAARFPIYVHRNYAPELPPLVMLRRHASETFINVLQNAREALEEKGGHVSVSARCHDDYSIEVVIEDDGPGIPRDKQEKIFEAYYTTKEKGTGLGLATVKHNLGLYGGTVRVESELGNGARFILLFPAKTLMNLAQTN